MKYWNLGNKYSNADKNALRCIKREDGNWDREQKFPLIHQIIFGRSRKLLKDEISDNPDAIFAIDAKGRTALDWAIARAQLENIRLLITSGSKLNSMDLIGRTPLHTAIQSHNIEIFRMVIEAGAEPNPQIPEGLRRGTPLTSASMYKHTEMVKLLINHKAKIDAKNPEGLTSLHWAVLTQNIECAEVLLEHGADMDCMSSNGRTPLMTAIVQNYYHTLRFLLDKRGQSLNGDSLLPIIAEHADSETMSILKSFQLFHLSSAVDLTSSRSFLYWRDASTRHAFENLISFRTGVAPPLHIYTTCAEPR